MIALALAAALAAAEPGAEAHPFDRACMDDYGRDLCDPGMRAEIRAKFGVPSAEDLARQGFEGVRVFTVNGYSRDMPLISVLRRPMGQATLEVRVDGGATMTTPASAWTWRVADSLADLAKASPPHPPEIPPAVSTKGGNDDDDVAITICLHAWVTVTEVISRGRVTTRIRNACGEDPLFDGSFFLSTLALRAFSGCFALNPLDYRNDSDRLIGCSHIKGKDGYTSAALYNAVRRSPPFGGSWGVTVLPEQWLAEDVVVEQVDEPDQAGRVAVAAAWPFRPGRGGVRLFVDSVDAGFETGAVTGIVERDLEDGKLVSAPFTQHWVNTKGVWRLKRWTIGEFAPVTK
ncbi:MAG: hypothetical protein ACOY4K_11270 [Pseudomonadota bacterium]